MSKNNVTKKSNFSFSKFKYDVKNYKNALQKAYEIGYNDGYNSYKKIPNVKGAYRRATNGYNKALSDCKLIDKTKYRQKRYSK